MASALPPITGVSVSVLSCPRLLSDLLWSLIFSANQFYRSYGRHRANYFVQMLRRGLVLDLSTAFGESTDFLHTPPEIEGKNLDGKMRKLDGDNPIHSNSLPSPDCSESHLGT